MKQSIFLFCLLIHLSSFTQTGQTAVKIAKHITKATLPVTVTLTAIEDSQRQVLKSSKNIAYKSAAIAVLKEDELASLTKEPEGLRETTHWKESLAAAIGIVDYNIKSVNILQELPELQNYVSLNVLVKLGAKTISLSEDIENISKAGSDNRMTPTGRYKLIKKVNQRLLKLYALSKQIHKTLKALALITRESEAITYDVTEPLNSTLERINTLIKD